MGKTLNYKPDQCGLAALWSLKLCSNLSRATQSERYAPLMLKWGVNSFKLKDAFQSHSNS